MTERSSALHGGGAFSCNFPISHMLNGCDGRNRCNRGCRCNGADRGNSAGYIREANISYSVKGKAAGIKTRCFLYNENHAIVAWLKRGLPMSLEKKTPIV